MASEARLSIRTDTKQTEQSVRSVRGMFADLGKDAKSSILAGVGLGAGVTAFAALGSAASAAGDFIMGSVKAAAEEEVGIRRLTVAIEENVAGWDGNIEAIERVIDEREKLGFADGEQRDSLAVLTSVTKDHNKALDLQRTAMDLARLRGMSLGAASELLGKVYAGNLGILSRYGIQLARGTSATEALAEIQRRAAGQAEAFGETAAGAAAALAIEWENLQEEVGEALLPVLIELANWAREDGIPALRGLLQTAKDAAPIFEALGTIITNLGVPSAGVADKVADLRAELEALEAQGTEADWSRAHMALGQEASEAFAGVSEDADVLVEDMRELPGDIADAIRDGREDWQDALAQLTTDIADETTKAARIAELQAALIGTDLARGLASTDRLVQNQAIATRNLILEQLAIEGVFQSGYNVGSLWSQGLAGGVLSHLQKVQASLWQYKQLMIGKSPPPKGPLRDVDTGGFNIGVSWAENMRKGIGTFAMPALGLGASGGAVPAMAGASAGGEIHTHVYLDGREIAETVDRWQGLMRPGGPARLPR